MEGCEAGVSYPHRDVTEVVKEIKLLLMKGIDICEELTSTGVLLLESNHTNVLMARGGRYPRGHPS